MFPIEVQAHHPAAAPSPNFEREVSGLGSQLAAINRQLFSPLQPLHRSGHEPARATQHQGLPRIATGAPRAAAAATTLNLNHQHAHQQAHQYAHQRAAGGPASLPFPRHPPTGAGFVGGHLGAGPLHPENSLRRKTPRGTVDAGYDGSPGHLSQGPPPLKHMLFQPSGAPVPRPLPTAPGTYRFAVNNFVTEGVGTSHHSGLIAESPFPGTDYGFAPTPMFFQQAQYQAVPGMGLNPTPGGPSLDAAFDGLSPAASLLTLPDFSPAHFGAPQGATGMRSGFRQAYLGDAVLFTTVVGPTWDSPLEITSPHNYMLSGYQHSSLAALPYHLAAAGTTQPIFDGTGYANMQPLTTGMDGLSPQSLLPAPPLSLDLPEHVGFKDRVLAQAYRTYQSYLELVAQAASGSKDGAPRSGPSHLTRIPVFPKAPKPSGFFWTAPSARATGLDGGAFAPIYAADAGSGGPYQFATRAEVPMAMAVQNSLGIVTSFCEQSKSTWTDGMLMGGCLLHILGRFEEAASWFSKAIMMNPSRVDAISNLAAALYCLDRHDEAEAQWLEAIKLRPDYLEAVEHLVTMFYKRKAQEAVQAIQYVQQSLRLEDGQPPLNPDPHVDLCSSGFGSSGYALSGSENGRMLALIHAKATLLYGLKQTGQAAEAFEEAVLVGTGRTAGGVRALMQKIQRVLMQDQAWSHPPDPPPPQDQDLVRSLLLLPHRAKRTALLIFSGNGDMPGLRFVVDAAKKRNAICTTSNSLLSLAKIFQDNMATGNPSGKSYGVADILALYYLSLSLHESPSTANNVGILLASVQQSAQRRTRASLASTTTQLPQGGGDAGGARATSGGGIDYALEYYKYGLALDPSHVHLLTNYGSLLKDLGMLDAAIEKYSQAVAKDPTFDIALTNLANAVKDRGRIKDALVYYRRAVDANPDFAEAVCGLSNTLNSVCDWKKRGGVYLNNGRFDRWHVSDNGALQDVLLTKRGSGVMQKVVGIVQRQLEEASRWGAGVLQASVVEFLANRALMGTDTTKEDIQMRLLKWSGRPWEGSQIVRFVERVTRAKMREWYLDRYERPAAPKADDAYLRPRLPAALTVPVAPTVLPFHTFTCPLTARDIRTISQRNALRISCTTLKSSWIPDTVYPPPPPPRPHLNVGYVSSDFNNHPLAHLMQSVFGLHNRARAKAYCYATTPSDGSIHRQQIERESPQFRDVSGWATQDVVDQIVRDGIHILVNLNGYTRGARNDIFAARPAPIQMSFMGFAGTMGTEWCDYLLADTTAVPPPTLRPYRGNVSVTDVFEDNMYDDEDRESDWVYSENLIYCRDTFFCCDHAQSCNPIDRVSTWEDEQRQRWAMRKAMFPGLPDDFVLLGNFNQLYKIEPTTFRSWLRILSRVPNAVLWLLRFPNIGEDNLRQTALEWGGPHVAQRIIFTEVAPKKEHIARARVCDLFLDTPECNAHTTAADVLWSSTPLLTLPRYPYKMCSRMAASILKGAFPRGPEGDRAAGELIAADEDEYEAFAVQLASGLTYKIVQSEMGPAAEGLPPVTVSYGQGVGRLAELRRLLFASKWTCALFDTKRWVMDLERAYDEAWRRWVAGEKGDIFL